jgi:hypothetical protein
MTGSSPPGYLRASRAKTGNTKNKPSMRNAKMLANEALARRSKGVMSKESAEDGCNESATKNPMKGTDKRRIVPD